MRPEDSARRNPRRVTGARRLEGFQGIQGSREHASLSPAGRLLAFQKLVVQERLEEAMRLAVMLAAFETDYRFPNLIPTCRAELLPRLLGGPA